MGIDRGRDEQLVSKQPSGGGQANAVHDSLRGPTVTVVMNAQAGFFAVTASEGSPKDARFLGNTRSLSLIRGSATTSHTKGRGDRGLQHQEVIMKLVMN